MNQALAAIGRNDRITDKQNVQWHAYHDKASLTNATTQVKFFLNGVGQGTTIFGGTGTKTDADTNWPASSYLPGNTKFVIGAVRIILEAQSQVTAAYDCFQVLKTAVFRLKVKGQERIGPILCSLLPGGAGVAVGAATTATAQFASHGIADPRAVAGLGSLPVSIYAQQKVEGIVDFPNGAPAITAAQSVIMTCVLDGVLASEI